MKLTPYLRAGGPLCAAGLYFPQSWWSAEGVLVSTDKGQHEKKLRVETKSGKAHAAAHQQKHKHKHKKHRGRKKRHTGRGTAEESEKKEIPGVEEATSSTAEAPADSSPEDGGRAAKSDTGIKSAANDERDDQDLGDKSFLQEEVTQEEKEEELASRRQQEETVDTQSKSATEAESEDKTENEATIKNDAAKEEKNENDINRFSEELAAGKSGTRKRKNYVDITEQGKENKPKNEKKWSLEELAGEGVLSDEMDAELYDRYMTGEFDTQPQNKQLAEQLLNLSDEEKAGDPLTMDTLAFKLDMKKPEVAASNGDNEPRLVENMSAKEKSDAAVEDAPDGDEDDRKYYEKLVKKSEVDIGKGITTATGTTADAAKPTEVTVPKEENDENKDAKVYFNKDDDTSLDNTVTLTESDKTMKLSQEEGSQKLEEASAETRGAAKAVKQMQEEYSADELAAGSAYDAYDSMNALNEEEDSELLDSAYGSDSDQYSGADLSFALNSKSDQPNVTAAVPALGSGINATTPAATPSIPGLNPLNPANPGLQAGLQAALGGALNQTGPGQPAIQQALQNAQAALGAAATPPPVLNITVTPAPVSLEDQVKKLTEQVAQNTAALSNGANAVPAVFPPPGSLRPIVLSPLTVAPPPPPPPPVVVPAPAPATPPPPSSFNLPNGGYVLKTNGMTVVQPGSPYLQGSATTVAPVGGAAAQGDDDTPPAYLQPLIDSIDKWIKSQQANATNPAAAATGGITLAETKRKFLSKLDMHSFSSKTDAMEEFKREATEAEIEGGKASVEDESTSSEAAAVATEADETEATSTSEADLADTHVSERDGEALQEAEEAETTGEDSTRLRPSERTELQRSEMSVSRQSEDSVLATPANEEEKVGSHHQRRNVAGTSGPTQDDAAAVAQPQLTDRVVGPEQLRKAVEIERAKAEEKRLKAILQGTSTEAERRAARTAAMLHNADAAETEEDVRDIYKAKWEAEDLERSFDA
ncbi:unnamed protein product [Amoebophrya sp. A120]|nr:unnamed protein product [Amoebophrya sp. A120]|eukprot:GSA120T00015505001.1